METILNQLEAASLQNGNVSDGSCDHILSLLGSHMDDLMSIDDSTASIPNHTVFDLLLLSGKAIGLIKVRKGSLSCCFSFQIWMDCRDMEKSERRAELDGTLKKCIRVLELIFKILQADRSLKNTLETTFQADGNTMNSGIRRYESSRVFYFQECMRSRSCSKSTATIWP